MRPGGCPAQLVWTMTCTSEISGSASKGMFRNDQIPASTSRSVATKTRKRFSAHQSIQRAITLHPSRGVQTELFCCDRLPVLFREDGDLPSSSAVQLGRALVHSVSFFGEREWGAHGRHTHRWHGWHEERDGDFCTGKWSATCIAQFHADDVGPATERSRIGGE